MENRRTYITVMDFSDGSVTQYYSMSRNKITTEEVEDRLVSKGFSLSNIEYMIHYDNHVNQYVW